MFVIMHFNPNDSQENRLIGLTHDPSLAAIDVDLGSSGKAMFVPTSGRNACSEPHHALQLWLQLKNIISVHHTFLSDQISDLEEMNVLCDAAKIWFPDWKHMLDHRPGHD